MNHAATDGIETTVDLFTDPYVPSSTDIAETVVSSMAAYLLCTAGQCSDAVGASRVEAVKRMLPGSTFQEAVLSKTDDGNAKLDVVVDGWIFIEVGGGSKGNFSDFGRQ